MTLLVTAAELAARRAAAAGPLAPLAQSLAGDLEPLLAGEPFIPPEKARLSRDGGRCPADGTLLDFDPASPRAHRCPACGATYEGEAHYRFWIYWYQLWLGERAVHAALLHALGAGDRWGTLARDILGRYAERYASYPNVDNVLGPTRLFFSTYLESIWLLQIAVAVDLLELAGDRTIGGVVRERIVEPSSAIIAGYDEGASNRQVWNNAALLAAARLLGRDADAERALFGPSGVASHLEHGLLADGSWYEGENYHLFAHRGLWYGVEMAARAGLALPERLLARYGRGFVTPWLVALPDLTLPSRRDSQYAISLRQWRFAEFAELGLACGDDARLVGALARLYGDDVPRRDTGRARSSAEAERNLPATSLSRADLGWRSLLAARPELPPLERVPADSAHLPAQGLAVFRREEGRVYLALDYGHSGGGHGHPDRLNLLLSDGPTRWLDDYGTGSYVDPSLHWYRSTLAHNAPLANGASQRPVNGILLAHEERGAAGWISAMAEIAPGVTVARTLVVMPDYALDLVSWESDPAGRLTTLDLPLHLLEGAYESQRDASEPEALVGGAGLEDGFDFVSSTWRQEVKAGELLGGGWLPAVGPRFQYRVVSAQPAEWWVATGPGAPGQGRRPFFLLRSKTPSGAHVLLWDWSTAVQSLERDGDALVVRLADGTRHAHAPTPDGWHVELFALDAHSSIDLGGIAQVGEGDHASDDAPGTRRDAVALSRHGVVMFGLGAEHYRRSEESWVEAGRPIAAVELRRHADALLVRVAVPASHYSFAPGDAVNPYDNEHPDVNGDGVQLHVALGGAHAGWTLVPERRSAAVRVRAIAGSAAAAPPEATWRAAPGRGYVVDVRLPLPRATREIELGVVVNEKPFGRERRRGQLVLGGARGEFVYLRGDRLEPDRLLRVRLVD